MKIANSNLKDQRKAITQCVNLGKQKVPLKKNIIVLGLRMEREKKDFPEMSILSEP